MEIAESSEERYILNKSKYLRENRCLTVLFNNIFL